jgi:hypothetical protein
MSQGPQKPPQNLPPRMLNNKYSPLSPEERTPYRHEIVQQPPPPIRTPPVGSSSRESSRPQTPSRERDLPPLQAEVDEDSPLTDVEREVAKNIFDEFVSFRKSDETLEWIQERFKGYHCFTFILYFMIDCERLF